MIRFFVACMLAGSLALTSCSKEGKEEKLLERADTYYEEGKYSEAVIEYKNLRRRASDHPHATRQLGLIWMEDGSPFQALPYLAKAHQAAPGDPLVHGKLAHALHLIGQRPLARKEALGVLETEPAHEQALLILLETSGSEEELAEVRDHLATLSKLTPVPLSYHLASAALAGRSGNLAEAARELEQALALDPESVSAHLAMAGVRERQGDLARAESSLREAVRWAPLRSFAHLSHASFLLRQGKAEQSRVLLEELKEKVPGYLPVSLALAQSSLRAKDYDRALRDVETVLYRDPKNFDARMIHVQALMAKGEPGKALELVKLLDGDFPNMPVIKFHLAQGYLASGDSEAALTALGEALELNPGFTDAHVLRAEIHLHSGNPELTLQAMSRLLAQVPAHQDAKSLVAAAHQALGQPEKSLAILREQGAADPGNIRLQVKIGMTLRQLGQIEEARAVFLQANELSPDNPVCSSQLVELDLAAGRIPQARERIESLLSRDPSAFHYTLKARLHVALKEWEEGEAAAKKCLEIKPNSLQAYNLLVSIYLATGRLEAARSEVETVLAEHPENPGALMLAATMDLHRKDYASARRRYEALLALNPGFVPAQNNLALLYADHFGELDKAATLATRARATLPNDPSIADTLGWVQFKRGAYQEALVLLKESASALPDQAQVQYHLGRAHYMMAEPEKALAAFNRALALGKEFPGQEDARRRIALLSPDAGSPSQSREELQAFLEENPKDLLARMRLARLHQAEGRPAEAARACEQVLEENPDFLPAAQLLAHLYADHLGDLPRALEYARTARKLAPDDRGNKSFLGQLQYRSGEYLPAYTLLRENASTPAALHDLAHAAYALGKVPEAVATMTRIKDEAPESGEASSAAEFLTLLSLEDDSDQLLQSKSQVAAILQKNPGHGPALMTRGAIALAEGDEKTAVASYGEILRRYPECAPAQLALATILASDPERLDEAHKLAMSARAALPEDTTAAQVLAVVNYHRKEYDYAIQLLQQVQGKQPLDSTGLAYLGLARWHTGEKGAAIPILKQASEGELEPRLRAEVTEALAPESSEP